MNIITHMTEVYGDRLAKHLLQNVEHKLIVRLSEVIQDLPARIREIGLVGVNTADFFDDDEESEAYSDAWSRLWIELDTLRGIINLYCSEEYQLPNFFEHFKVPEKIDKFSDEVREARRRRYLNKPDSLRSYAGVYLKVPTSEMPKGELRYGLFAEKINDKWTAMVLPSRTHKSIKHYLSCGAKVFRVIGPLSRSVDSEPLP